MPNPIDPIAIDLDQIQGNVLAGFNKDHQRFLFLSIQNPVAAKTWLHNMLPHISKTTDVKAFNDEFRRQRTVLGVDPPNLVATWMNIAITFSGLQILGVKDLSGLPAEYVQGMAARKNIVGDLGASDPTHWQPAFQDPHKLNLLVMIASDDPAALVTQANTMLSSLPAGGLTLLLDQHGENPTGPLAGHEQFGFKDGISQPGVKGFTVSINDKPAADAGHQGVPGQDLLWPGEFVIGYPTQVPVTKANFDGPNPDQGPVSTAGPAWTKDGSFLVFRKLQQDVPGFRNNVTNMASTLGVSPEVLGAKMVGRYLSGCPMQPTAHEVFVDSLPTLKAVTDDGFPVSFDPSDGDPSDLHSEMLHPNLINDFEYGNDLTGEWVPRGGHVRKAYPRDEVFLLPNGQPDPNSALNESFTQTKRMLRRGIPYGPAIPLPVPVAPTLASATAAEATSGTNGVRQQPPQPVVPSLPIHLPPFPVERGLLFLAYQKSIANQFEFVQQNWINNPNFPQTGDGIDPIMSQTPSGPMSCPIKGKPHTLNVPHFVTTTGGEYFFQPSISALTMMATA